MLQDTKPKFPQAMVGYGAKEGKRWTGTADKLLVTLYKKGWNDAQLAQYFGRTLNGIRSRIKHLTESAPRLFGGDEAEGSPSQGTLSTRVFVLTKGTAGLHSGPCRPIMRRLDAECGQCGYTTDKCTCDYGI